MESVKNSRAWLIFVIAAMGIPYQFYLQSTPGVMVAGLHTAFGLDSAQIGVLTSCFFYTYLALQIPAGIVVDVIGARLSLIVGMAGCALGCACFAAAPNYGCAIAARLLMGLSASFFVPAAMVTAQGWHPASRFALLAGMAESIGMAGGGLGEEAIGHGVMVLGWRSSMWISAAAGVVVLLLIAAVVRDRRVHACEEQESMLKRLSCLSSCFAQVVKIPKLWLIALFAALTFGALAAFAGLWVVPYLQLRFSLAVDHAALLGSAIFIGVAICAPACGAWYARSNNKKFILRSLTLGACLLFTALLFLPIAISMILPAMLLLGAFSSVYVLSFGLVPEVVPDHLRGAGVGLVNMGAMLIGAPILQPAIGWWLRVAPQNPTAILAHYQQALSVLSIGLLVAVMLVTWLPVPKADLKEEPLVDGVVEG
jgi:MFS family permease